MQKIYWSCYRLEDEKRESYEKQERKKEERICINDFFEQNEQRNETYNKRKEIDQGLYLIQTFSELYEVVSYDRILEHRRSLECDQIRDSNNETISVSDQVKWLTRFGKYHEDIMWITYVIYQEQKELEQYQENRERDERTQRLEDRLIEFLLTIPIYHEQTGFIGRLAQFFIEEIYRTDLYDSLYREAIFNINRLRDMYHYTHWDRFYPTVKQICLALCKSGEFGFTGIKIWWKCFHSEFTKEFDTSNLLEMNIVETLDSAWSDELFVRQRAIQENMLLSYRCYYKAFNPNPYEHLKQIRRVLESDYYLKEEYLNKSKKNCFAVLHADSEKFAAISGFHGIELFISKLETALRNILGTQYILSNDQKRVRYYYDQYSGHFVDVNDYLKVKSEVNREIIYSGHLNRLFSCCERKLLVELRNKKYKKSMLVIKMEPCFMCKRAIRFAENIPYENEKEHTTEYTDSEIAEFDRIALLIKEKKEEYIDAMRMKKEKTER